MPTDSRHKRGRRGSTMILFTLMLPTLLIPLVGLGIDATMLYIVQAKLSAAVDGAALGAGRLLGTPANPQEIAGEFLSANFRASGVAGFWGAYNLTPTITYVNGITKTITVNATARVPLLFARIFGQPNALVAATASATRADSRVVLIIDRSGSMTQSDGAGSTVIADVKSYAQAFTQQFSEGTDEVGLVVFDGSAVVGYPTGIWTSAISMASTGGPNTTFNDGSANNMVNQIGAITANSGTGMADAISIAYIELQKAHMRDLQAFGVDNRLNSIVLFTDGVPSAMSIYINNPANNLITSSACVNRNNAPATKMLGWLALPGPPYSGPNDVGMYQIASLDTAAAHTAVWWMSHGGSDATNLSKSDGTAAAPFNGCDGLDDTNINDSTKSDLTKIPSADLYGNSTAAGANGGYTNSHIVGGSVTSIYTGTALNLTKPLDDYHWGLAIWDTVDWAARTARMDGNKASRAGDTTTMPIAIYTVGYTGNGGADDGLLRRVANDKSSSAYDSTQATGIYVQASNKAALAAAFNTIASAILRLSQ